MLPKVTGTIAEFQVIIKLLDLGFQISKTQGDYSGYDIISDWQGKLNRIQIKSTKGKKSTAKGYDVTVGRGNSSKRKYEFTDCDFIICVVPEAFYIIPITEVVVVKFRLHPKCDTYKSVGINYTGRWEKYKNQWDLLK